MRRQPILNSEQLFLKQSKAYEVENNTPPMGLEPTNSSHRKPGCLDVRNSYVPDYKTVVFIPGFPVACLLKGRGTIMFKATSTTPHIYLEVYYSAFVLMFNTLRPRQNGRRVADDTFKHIFLNENARISIEISLKFVPKSPINNNPALVQKMACRRSGDKPLSWPMMVSLLTHIRVTRPQWVKIARDINRWPETPYSIFIHLLL